MAHGELSGRRRNAFNLSFPFRLKRWGSNWICRFQRGDKVLCLIYEGFNAVFPAIVVEPLSEEDLRRSYTAEGWDFDNPSVDELIKNWWDWNWDSVVVRPLVRIIDCCMIPMGETVIVNRVYVFPYKKFDI